MKTPLRLRFDRRPELPLLAWCAHLDPRSGTVRVAHGEGVEARDDAFFEGAWSGDFVAFDPLASPVRCGTGGALREGRLQLTPGTDRQNPLFSIRRRDGTWVSNSPMFAMAAAGEEPDPIYPFYPYDFVSFWRAGLYWPSGPLRLGSGRKLCMHPPVTLELDARGPITFSPIPSVPVPCSFESYREILEENVARVFANAADPARRALRFRPLAAISQGYDSTATAVLAARAGCREAATIFFPRPGDPRADSGAESARRLGMHCTEHHRFAYRLGDGTAEAETGWSGYSACAPWTAAEDRLRGSLFVTGRGSEDAWDARFTAVISRGALPSFRLQGMVAQSEFRLRAGYASFAPATIAAEHVDALHRIAWSDPMRPWQVGGDYDRPIPRRLIEESGLPRGTFAARNMGSAHAHLSGPDRFSEKGWAAYRDHVEASHAAVSPARRRLWRAAVEARYALWRRLGRERPNLRTSPLARRFSYLASALPPGRELPWEALFTFSWCFAETRARYEPARSPAG